LSGRRFSTVGWLRLLLGSYFGLLVIIGATVVPTLVETLSTLNQEQTVYDTASSSVSDLLIGALNQETGVRGYVLSADPSFLQPDTLGVTQYDHSLAQLKRIDLGPTFSNEVSQTSKAFGQWQGLADQIVAAVRRGDSAGARQLSELSEGKSRFDAFRTAQDDLGRTVHHDLESSRHSLHLKVTVSLVILVAALGLGVLVGIGLLFWWRVSGRDSARLERKMADQSVLLQAAIDATSDSIFAKDLEGRHILSNRARVASLTQGASDVNIVGRTVEEFLSPELAQETRDQEREIVRTGVSSELEERLPQPDGTHFYRVSKAPLRDAVGSVTGIVGVARDVTIQRELLLDRERLYQLEHELVTALQLAMLGNDTLDHGRVEASTRYVPALDRLSVGGDWYDLIALSSDRVGFTVGDAVGHGVESATAMGQLRSALAAIIGMDLDPGPTLEGLDEFARRNRAARYATCVYAILDPPNEKMTFSSAGQLPGVIVDVDGSVELLSGTQDPPLSVSRRPRHTNTRPFSVGSTVLFYTDGLVERRGESIEIGLQRLVRTVTELPSDLPIDELCDRIIDEMDESGVRHDDVALVALRLLKGTGG
jgi:PAS domain S-box-containing protein